MSARFVSVILCFVLSISNISEAKIDVYENDSLLGSSVDNTEDNYLPRLLGTDNDDAEDYQIATGNMERDASPDYSRGGNSNTSVVSASGLNLTNDDSQYKPNKNPEYSNPTDQFVYTYDADHADISGNAYLLGDELSGESSKSSDIYGQGPPTGPTGDDLKELVDTSILTSNYGDAQESPLASSNSVKSNDLSLDNGYDDTQLTLQAHTKEGKLEGSLTIDLTPAIRSNLIKTMWQGDQTETDIPLPKVELDTLTLVVEYLKHYAMSNPSEIKKPIQSSEMIENVDEWDADFIDRVGQSKDNLFRLILAANYMDIRDLLNLACAKVASMIKGKSPDEIRTILSQTD